MSEFRRDTTRHEFLKVVPELVLLMLKRRSAKHRRKKKDGQYTK